MEYQNLFKRMSAKERIEIVTMLDTRTAFTGCVIRAEALRDISNDMKLRQCFSGGEFLFCRTVSHLNDVYSFKTKTISLHPSTYAFLLAGGCKYILTWANDKFYMCLSELDDFTSILDLGIGYLRRADFALTKIFTDSQPLNLNSLLNVKKIVTEPVRVDPLSPKCTAKIIPYNSGQGELF